MFGTYRLVLACLVALSHYGLIVAGFNPGQWAVLSFYVLSGFLMENQFHKLSTARLFYLDRLLRIYPLFLVVLLFAIILTRFSAATVLANICLFPLDYNSLLGLTLIIAPAWSLACEAHFYLLVPLFARSSTLQLRWILSLSVLIFMISPFLPNTGFWAYGGLPGILFAFLSGMLIKRKDLFFLRSVWVFFLVLLAAFVYSKLSHSGLPTGIHINVALGYLFALPLILWLSSFSSKVVWDQRLGLLAYPLFLIHDPARRFVCLYVAHPSMFLLLLSAIAASGMLVFLVEKPLDKIRYKIRKPEKKP